MARYQSGHVFEAHGAFHVRYYATEIVDGKPKTSATLEAALQEGQQASLSQTCKAVKQLAATEMEKVNGESGVTQQADITVTDFWDTIYLPHIEKTTKPSTSSGYKAIWRQNLSAVFAGFNLRDYQTHHATRYLTSLADKGLGREQSLTSGHLPAGCSSTPFDSTTSRSTRGVTPGA